MSIPDFYERLNIIEQETPEPPKSLDFYERLSDSPKKRSLKEDIQKAPDYFFRGAGAAIKSTPRAISGLLKHGQQYLAQKGLEQAEKEGKDFSKEELAVRDLISKWFGAPEDFLQKHGFPTYQEALQMIKESKGDDEFDPSGLEKGFETAGEFVGSSLPFGLGSAKNIGNLALAATGGGLASAAGASEGEQLAGAFTLPTLINAIYQIKKGKFRPSGAEAKELYEFGKSKGLSDKELAPILQNQRKLDTFGSVAARTRRAERAIKTSESALGKIYDDIKQRGGDLPKASRSQESRIIHQLDNVSENLKKSKFKHADKDATIKKIDEMIYDIAANGIDPEEIVATWQDLNSSINWNSFRDGKRHRNAIKDPLMNLLKELDPQGAKEFAQVNKMWGRLQNTGKKVSPKTQKNWQDYGPTGALAAGLYQLVMHGNPAFLGAVGKIQAGRLISTEMLINPKLNGLMNKTIASLTKGTQASTQKAIRDFEKGLREYPEIHDAFVFEEDKED